MASSTHTHPSHPAREPGHAGNHSNAEGLSPSAVNRILMEYAMYVGRGLCVVYPIYLMGYLGFSISWVLLCMFMIIWWKKNSKWKVARIGSSIDLADNEMNVIKEELENSLKSATWLHISEVEQVEWFNKVLKQAWPFFSMYMEKLLREKIQPVIRVSNSALKTFAFTKIHFGHKPLKITGIRAYTDEAYQREVILDLNINYDSDVDIRTEVKKLITAGVNGLKFQGTLRIILEPLISESPLIGGITYFFIRRPTLEINWTGMTAVLDSPAFSTLSEDAILDIIASKMVLPNRMAIPLIDQVQVEQMRFPLPRGVVRVHLLEARNLKAMDPAVFGPGTSDPYGILRVGPQHFTSTFRPKTLNPVWKEEFQFVVHEASGQELELEMFDKDRKNDDPLGRCNIKLNEVKENKEVDKWFPLEDGDKGEVHLKLQWLSLKTDPSLLEVNGKPVSAMLAIYLESASSLPQNHSEMAHLADKKSSEHSHSKVSNLNSYVEFSIDEQVQKSKIAYSSKDPTWEEGFVFFVNDVKSQILCVKVKKSTKGDLLGELRLPLCRLQQISNMVLDQRFNLGKSGANSQIKLKATLRSLKLEEPIIKSPPPEQQQTLPPNGSTPKNRIPEPPKAETLKLPKKAPRLQLDSRSLLSEKSISSSLLNISDKSNYPEAIRSHRGSFGEIHLTIRYIKSCEKLMVQVKECRELFRCDCNGTDSYVRLYLVTDQSKPLRKTTHVKKKTINPIFDEKFEFNVSLEKARNAKLDVAVKNNTMFHTRQRKDIGMVEVDLSQLDLFQENTDWFKLTLPGLEN